MVCETQVAPMANAWEECKVCQLVAEDEDCSTEAESDILASEPDEDIPPVFTLERTCTFTFYNDDKDFEWQQQSSSFALHTDPQLSSLALQTGPADVQAHVVTELSHCAPLLSGGPAGGYVSQGFPQWNQHQQGCLKTWQHGQWFHKANLSCKQLADHLAAGGEHRDTAIQDIRGRVRELTFDAAGCRIIQQVIQTAGRDVAVAMASELHGYVYAALQSPHGNYVIQKIVETLPPTMSRFVAEELAGVAGPVSCHRFGCRILCRLLEHCSGEQAVVNLANELIQDVVSLSADVFAHHVIQALLEHGSPEQKHYVVQSLVPRSFEHARDRNASYVLETAILCGKGFEQEALLASIASGGAGGIAAMAYTQSGSRVLKAFLTVDATAMSVWRTLQASTANLNTNKQGRRFMQEIGMLF